jgi:alpha-glucosidase
MLGECSTTWWRSAVFYQVYPRSFADSNGDGIGDLPGVTARLDYLNDGSAASLQVDALWLSPFFPSPEVDFGYDVSDFTAVDPVYGTLTDFDRLLDAAHRRGIRVILDLVLNHSSTKHPWFLEAQGDRLSPRRSWYIWADPAPAGGPPNNWLSSFPAVGSAWTLDERSGQYFLTTFTPAQADLNWHNPDVRHAMHDVMRFWLSRGVDGFRLDVPHRLAKDPMLRDNPPSLAAARRFMDHAIDRQRHIDLPDVHEILRGIRAVVDEFEGRVLLGEVTICEPRRLVRYFGDSDDELHMVFDVLFWDSPWSAPAFREAIAAVDRLVPPWSLPCRAMSTHDHRRAASRYGLLEGDGRRARLAAMMQMTLRSVPCIYYGEEIGMTDVPVGPERIRDIDQRDPNRTPMQWGTGTLGAFDPARSWLPMPDEPDRVSVLRQTTDPNSLLAFYRRLLAYRRQSTPLRHGSFEWLPSRPDLLAYCRAAQGTRIVVLLNFARHESPAILPPDAEVAVAELSTDPRRRVGTAFAVGDPLSAEEGLILRLP